jgi:DNA-binding NarL/FixJ family response regulator
LAAELDSPAGREPRETLADREHQVFGLLGAGKPVGEIAETLALSSNSLISAWSRFSSMRITMSAKGNLPVTRTFRVARRHGRHESSGKNRVP